MIVDLRIYTCKPNRLAQFTKLYREHGWETQSKHLGRCVGWYTTVEGQLNQIVHMWGYDSQADREKKRAAMAADPAWVRYLDIMREADLLVSMENRLLSPAEWSPVK